MGGREIRLTRGISKTREIFENLVLFLMHKTRDKSRRSRTRWVFFSKRSWEAGDQVVIFVKA